MSELTIDIFHGYFRKNLVILEETKSEYIIYKPVYDVVGVFTGFHVYCVDVTEAGPEEHPVRVYR